MRTCFWIGPFCIEIRKRLLFARKQLMVFFCIGLVGVVTGMWIRLTTIASCCSDFHKTRSSHHSVDRQGSDKLLHSFTALFHMYSIGHSSFFTRETFTTLVSATKDFSVASFFRPFLEFAFQNYYCPWNFIDGYYGNGTVNGKRAILVFSVVARPFFAQKSTVGVHPFPPSIILDDLLDAGCFCCCPPCAIGNNNLFCHWR